MKQASLQVKVREMVMKTTQMATRFVITSLLTALAPIVLFAPQAYAESYVAGQLGATFPGNGLSNGDLTFTSVPIPDGMIKVSDQSLKTSFMFGGKIGHYLSKARWFGFEAEIFYTNPHIKQQNITLRTDAPVTVTLPGGGPITIPQGEFPVGVVQGANFHVLTIAPLNLMFRYPGNRLQPYIGVGPGIFIARIKAPVPQGDDSQSSTKLGLNALIGARYFITRHISAFAEAKYNYVRFNFAENPNFFGFNATYAPISVAFGIAYHF